MSTKTFRTAVIRTPGGPDSIEIIEVPVTEPGPGQIRVAVAAAAVNPVDIGVADGIFHARGMVNQHSWTGLGWDFSGIVVAAGAGVDLAPGTRVAGLVDGFDRDFGTHAEQLVVSAADVAVVPDELDLEVAGAFPLNALAASQIMDLLGEAPTGNDRLLVTGAAGAVGGHVLVLAQQHGWRPAGLARARDEEFVRGRGADFATDVEGRWDAVVDAAAMQEQAVPFVENGGVLIGVQPGADLVAERGITIQTVIAHPDGYRLAELLARSASGELPARVHEVLPLERAADAYRAVARGGIRGRVVLRP